MPRTKGVLNRATRDASPREEKNQVDMGLVKDIDGQVLESMSKTNRMRLTHSDPTSLSLRQAQTAGAEFLANLVGHPEFRKNLIVAGLKDPMSLLKIASSERPKEIHMEADIQHSVVVVPAQLSAEDWTKQVNTIEGETLKEENW